VQKELTMLTLTAKRATVAALLGLATCLALTAPVGGDQSTPVLRTFGFLVLDDDVPDFLSEDSLAITVLPDVTDPSAGHSLPLLVDAAHEELTEWESHPAHYATKGGAKFDGSFFWLLDDETPTPPPVGAHTFIGPTGLIESVEVVRIRICSSVNCGCACNNGLWTIDDVNGTRTLVIVTAWFSK
jgi:hypothetical protein